MLINFAALLQRSAPTGDLVARYGGEEFVMLCADCDNATITEREGGDKSSSSDQIHEAGNQ